MGQTPSEKLAIISKLVPGDVINTRAETLLGKAIRFCTNSNINHSTLYLGNGLLLEASYEVCIHHVNRYIYDDSQEIYACSPNINNKTKKLLSDASISTWGSGCSYNAPGLFGLAFRFIVQKYWWRISKLFNWSGANKSASKKSVWCSELVGLIYENKQLNGDKLIGNDFSFKFTDEDVTWLTPAQIYESKNVTKIN